LFALHRPTQPILQLTQHSRTLQCLGHRRTIRPPDVPMTTMYAPKQLADSCLKVRVTARAAPTAGRAEIRHRRVAKRAAHGIRHGRRLMMKKLAEWMLRCRDGRFDAAIRRAPLTQVQLMNRIVFDRRQMHDGIALAATVAQHQGTASRMSVSVRWP